MTKKIITVFGATGAQGGGLARAILAHPEAGFAARAVTRKPDSDKAQVLAKAGAEVVGADLDDAASVQRAMRGYDTTSLHKRLAPGYHRAVWADEVHAVVIV